MSPRLIDSEAIMSMNQQAEESMTQANVTMFSQQPYENQFRIGEKLVVNFAAFQDNRPKLIRFLREAKQTPRIGGVYRFEVSQLHGFEKFRGAEMICSPNAVRYISIKGSDKRFPEHYFLRAI